MHLLTIHVSIGARTNLVNVIILIGISFSFIALPSERFPINVSLFPLTFHVNRKMNIK